MKIERSIQTMPSGQTSIMQLVLDNVCANFEANHLSGCIISSYDDFSKFYLFSE